MHRALFYKTQALVHGNGAVVIGTHMQKRNLPVAYNNIYLVLHQCRSKSFTHAGWVRTYRADFGVLVYMQALPRHSHQPIAIKHAVVMPKLNGARPKRPGFGELRQRNHLRYMLTS